MFVAALGPTVVLLVASTWIPKSTSQNQTVSPPAYHTNAPTEPLPLTLDATQFSTNHPAFVAYSLASQVRETLYQVPCYCGCDKEHGHASLLDCFTSKHGVLCPICQKEVIFCYLERKRGKTPAEIREAMAEGKASKLNLKKLVARWYTKISDKPNDPDEKPRFAVPNFR